MSEIVSRECRFVYHIPKSYNTVDTHIVKEILHHKDGSTSKALRCIENFKRPFWTTKEHNRNHKQKKESEDLDKLLVDTSTESDLATGAAVKLGSRYNGVRDLRTIKRSPYIYGLDINSRTYIKHLYQEKFKISPTPYEVCIFDIEVNVITDEITILSIATNEKIFTVITKQYLQAKITTKDNVEDIEKDVIPKLEYLYDKHIPKTDISKNVIRSYRVAENPIDAIRIVMAKAHDWQPDIMAVWNISYDVGKLLAALKRAKIDPATIFCDPNLPNNLKQFKFKEGPKQKVTESGTYKPVNPEEQWHTVIAPASFYWIDAMCAHRYIRVGGKTVSGGYSLDNILKSELGDSLGKLKFKDTNTESIKGIDWHKYMTAERPLEYITYNQWDVLSVLELDKKTMDLRQVLPMLSGISNFDIFNSGPKRIIDALHFFYVDCNRVLSTKDPMVEDKDLLGLGGWITLLPSCRISEGGIPILEGGGNDSNIRMFVFDSD